MFKKIPRTLINLRLIIRIVGWLLIIEAGFLVFPTVTCLIYGESDWLPFGATSAGTLIVGLLLAWQSHPVSMYAGKRDGYLLTSLVWVVFSLFGLIPFLFCTHFCIRVVTYITPSLPYGCISSQVSFLMSLFLKAVRQENRNARFKAGAEQGVDAKRITSSCERCSLSVGIVSIRSRKPFGFSFILRSR